MFGRPGVAACAGLSSPCAAMDRAASAAPTPTQGRVVNLLISVSSASQLSVHHRSERPFEESPDGTPAIRRIGLKGAYRK